MVKKYFGENKFCFVRLIVLILVGISMITMDIKATTYIQKKQIESYWVQSYSLVEREVQEDVLQAKFQAVSKHMISMDLWCKDLDSPVEGTITYSVSDEDGNEVLPGRTVKLSDVWNVDGPKVVLDISDIEYELGKTYYLNVFFQTDQPIGVLTDANGLMHTQTYQAEYQGFLYGILILVHVLVIGLLAAYFKWGWNDKIFLVMILSTGVLSIILAPPFSREDEARHFVRAYDLSLGGEKGYYAVPQEESIGTVITNEEGQAYLIKLPPELAELRQVAYTDNYVQKSYLSEINQSICFAKLQSIFAQPEQEGMIEVSEEATQGKSAANYWPQIIMICLARAAGMRSGLWYYMAKLGQMLVSSLFLWFAMILMKNHRHLVWLFSFISPVMLLRASCNPDGLMMAEILLSISIMVYLRENKENLWSWKSLALLVIYFVLVYQVLKMKAPYALFCLGFLLLLKKENFAFLPWKFIREHKWKVAAGVVLVCGLAAVYLFGIRHGDIFMAAIHWFVPQEHIDYILTNTGAFAHLFLHRCKDLFWETKDCLSGSYYLSYGWIFFFVLLLSKRQFSIPLKCYPAFLFFAMLGVVVLVGYTWTPADYGQIVGVTYRYVLPFLPAAGFVLPFGTEKTEYYVEQIYPMVFIAAVAASCLAWVQM